MPNDYLLLEVHYIEPNVMLPLNTKSIRKGLLSTLPVRRDLKRREANKLPKQELLTEKVDSASFHSTTDADKVLAEASNLAIKTAAPKMINSSREIFKKRDKRVNVENNLPAAVGKFALQHYLTIGALTGSIILLFFVRMIISSVNSNAALKLGSQFASQKNYRAAIQFFSKAAEGATSPEPLLLEAEALSQLQQNRDAIKLYKQVLLMSPGNKVAIRALAADRIDKQDYGEAIRLYNLAITANHSTLDQQQLTEELGDALLASGNYFDAAHEFELAQKNDKTDPTAMLKSAFCLQKLGRPEDALAKCNEVLAHHHLLSDAYLERADCLALLGRQSKAADDFATAIKLSHGSSAPYVRKGAALSKAALFEEADKCFTKALQIDSECTGAYEERAANLLRQGNFREAQKEFNFLGKRPNYVPKAEYNLNRIAALKALEGRQKAICRLAQMHKQSPAQNEYALELARLFALDRDFSQALKLCDAVLDNNSKNLDAILLKAQINLSLGNKISAKAEVSEALHLSQSRADVYLFLGDINVLDGELFSAAENYRKSFSISPDEATEHKLKVCLKALDSTVSKVRPPVSESSPTKLTDLELKKIAKSDLKDLQNDGYVSMQNGNFLYAVKALAQAVQIAPNDAISRKYLSFALLKSGDFHSAYQQFVELQKIEKLECAEQFLFAKSLGEGGDLQDAKAIVAEISGASNVSTQVRLQCVQSLAQLHCNDEALSLIKKFIPSADSNQRVELLKIQTALTKSQDDVGKIDPANRT